jgi:hypothetical protein
MTFAEDMRRDNDLLRRRFVFATRKRGPLTLDEDEGGSHGDDEGEDD